MKDNFKQWVADNRRHILKDIKRLVDIKSVRTDPEPGAPYGQGVRAAQEEAMELCREAGMRVTDLDGEIAYAHYGDEERFIGIAAHLDVVPEGHGWDTPPYDMTVRDEYLVGRGVCDDKGPFVLALWAIRYILEKKIPLRYGVRLIIGLAEETGMSDIVCYNQRCTAPLFAFTPDAEFPVGHGEKGVFSATLISPALNKRVILRMEGGEADNIVPDAAKAVLSEAAFDRLSHLAAEREGITLEKDEKGLAVVKAAGLARHAGWPQDGVNAVHRLLCFLLDSGILEGEEEKAVQFMRTAAGDVFGSQFGLAAKDGLFSDNTIIAGTLRTDAERYALGVNCRYNTALSPNDVEERICSAAREAGFEVADIHNSPPYYLSADTPVIRLLTDMYNTVMSCEETPYVLSGGTYARHMKNAVSFGVEVPGVSLPEWAGTAHMKNEALGISQALSACEIFIHALLRLQEIDF